MAAKIDQKSEKIACKMGIGKGIPKRSIFGRFLADLGAMLGPCWDPKTAEKAEKMDGKFDRKRKAKKEASWRPLGPKQATRHAGFGGCAGGCLFAWREAG